MIRIVNVDYVDYADFCVEQQDVRRPEQLFFSSSPSLRPQRNVSVAAIHGDRTQTEREEVRNAKGGNNGKHKYNSINWHHGIN